MVKKTTVNICKTYFTTPPDHSCQEALSRPTANIPVLSCGCGYLAVVPVTKQTRLFSYSPFGFSLTKWHKGSNGLQIQLEEEEKGQTLLTKCDNNWDFCLIFFKEQHKTNMLNLLQMGNQKISKCCFEAIFLILIFF